MPRGTDIPALTHQSLRSLFVEMFFGETLLSSGTAFVVHTKKGPYLITNRHNVTGRHQETDQPLNSNGGIPDSVLITHHRSGAVGHFVKRKQLLLRDEEPLWIEHPVLKAKADFAALALTELQGVDLYPYPVPDKPSEVLLGPSETVSVIGFPFALKASGGFAVWSTGFVASEPDFDYNDLPVLLIDCRSRQGQSGSPVVLYKNGGSLALKNGSTAMHAGPFSELVGIYSGRIHKDSDLGMVWKAKVIRELITFIENPANWITAAKLQYSLSSITTGGTLNW